MAVESWDPLELGAPQRLFSGAPYLNVRYPSNRPWDIAPDGRVLMVKMGEGEGGGFDRVTVVVGWQQELERLVPIN